MMDAKLRKKIEAAIDAGDAIVTQVCDNPEQMAWGKVLAFVQQQHKAIKAARRAMANQDESRG